MPQVFFGPSKPGQKPTVQPEEIAELHCHLTLGVSCWLPRKHSLETDSSHLKIGKPIPNPDFNFRMSRLPLSAIFSGAIAMLVLGYPGTPLEKKNMQKWKCLAFSNAE